MRSGTLQYLHISEFGTICANFPDKAREIVTGALNTVETGQFTVIESTAEGQEGALPGLCQEAQARHNENLTPMDFKFHFFPWFQDKNYVLNGLGMPPIPTRTTTTSTTWRTSFASLYRENSAPGTSRRQTPKAATCAASIRPRPTRHSNKRLEGAYWAKELLDRREAAAGSPDFPYVPNALSQLVLGRSAATTTTVIWLHQYVDGYHRFVGYYENTGEYHLPTTSRGSANGRRDRQRSLRRPLSALMTGTAQSTVAAGRDHEGHG